jgi:hypothetical protein
MQKTVSLAVALLLPVLVLAGCGGNNARNILGMDRRAPDAYAVSTYAPLQMPSNLSSLPVPAPGVSRPQEVTPQQMARAATGMAPAQVTSAPSAAEHAMLAKAGPAEANVRVAVNKQAARDADTQSGPLDWMLFWREAPQPGVVVDASAEAKRIQAAKAAGQPVTVTATPVIDETGRLGVAREIK